MDIYTLARKARVPLKTLRRIEKFGALKVDKESEQISQLLFHMRGNMKFTLPMLLWLIDDPALIDELGYISGTYAKRAEAQLRTLGDVKATGAPIDVTAEIQEASKGNADAALVLAQWLMNVLPDERTVSYHWIAARLLSPLNAFLREQNAPWITLALLNVRRLPEFAGYWKSVSIGARNEIQYFAKKELAGLDL